MKRQLLSIIFSGIIPFLIFGQQPENPGFENWEDAGTVIDEPVDWSSIKTSDAGDFINNAAPVVWEQSDDAHTGNFSLKLKNVLTIGSIIATGTITNGRIHANFNPALANSYTDPTDARWHTPITGRPDSIAVWIKYYPQGTDTAQLKAVLHVDECTLPPTPENQNNWIAYAQINVWQNFDDWTRVVIPFTYFNESNPEYMLLILTAGAGLAPIDGSIAYYDDLELIYNPNGFGDLNANNALVYTFGMNIYLDKIPEADLKGARLDLINMEGASVWSASVSETQVSLEGRGIPEGIYVFRITGKEGVYTQKVQLR